MPEESKLRFRVISVDNGSFWIADNLHPTKDWGHPELITSKSKESSEAVCDVLNKWYALPTAVRRVYK